MQTEDEKKAYQREYARSKRARESEAINESRRRAYKTDPKKRAYGKDYYAKNAVRIAAWTRGYRARNKDRIRMRKRCANYGITVDDFREMWNLQAGRCWICLVRLFDDEKRDVQVDHDHTTGEVRGLLCMNCNNGLGCFRDNPLSLLRAVDYLRK